MNWVRICVALALSLELARAADSRAQEPGLFEQSLAADPPAPSGVAEPSEPSAPEFDLNGYVRGDLFVGKVPGFSQGVIKAGYGELALKLHVNKEAYGDAFAEARLRYGQQGRERDLFLELREAYVNVYLGPVDLRLGQQIIVWGRADAFNPTNNLTPVDMRIRSPNEDDRRLGNVGLRAFLSLTPVRLEAVWLPLYIATEYPPLDPGPSIELSSPDFPDPELVKGLGALRVHLELPDFEASASYLYGHAPLPGLALRDYTVGVEPAEVRVRRTAYDQHVAGLDFSTAFGDLFALRGEAALRLPNDYEARVYAARPDLQYVLGVERAFGAVSVIAQYVGRYVFDWEREEGPERPLDPETLEDFEPPLPRLLRESVASAIEEQLAERNQILFMQTARVQHLASVRVEWLTLHDTLSLSALVMMNFTTGELLAYPKLGYRISDRMSTYLGAEIYAGPEDSLLGLIDEELSAVYAEVRASF